MLTQVVILLLTLSLTSLLAWGGIRRLRHAQILSAGFRLGAAGSIGAAGLALFGLSSNLYTYQRFTSEQPVAQLHFRQISRQLFEVRYLPYQGKEQRFDLRGDEWMLDAKVLKWTGYATLLGFDPRFRLERLGGRYADIQQARGNPVSAFQLGIESGSGGWIDLWKLAREYDTGLVDAVYGNSVFLPMSDKAAYQITMGQSGLIARPLEKSQAGSP